MQLRAVDGDDHRDVVQTVGALHIVLEAVVAVGQVADGGPHPALPVIEQPSADRGVTRRAVGLAQLNQPPSADLVGAELGRQVPDALVGGACGGQERVEEFRHPLAGAGGQHRGYHMALLVQPGGMGRHRPGRVAAYVGVVGPVGHPTHEVASIGDGSHDGQVVEVGAAVVGIVDRVLGVELQHLAEGVDNSLHRGGHGAEMHGYVLGLGQQLAVRHEHRGREVGPLLDVG